MAVAGVEGGHVFGDAEEAVVFCCYAWVVVSLNVWTKEMVGQGLDSSSIIRRQNSEPKTHMEH